MVYRVEILGPFRMFAPDGSEVGLTSKKAQALVAMLAVAGADGVSRDQLTAVLWGDRGDDQARSSLRQALTAIRKALPAAVAGQVLNAGDDQVRLDPRWAGSDVQRLHALSGSGDIGSLSEAITQLDAELLDGFNLREAAFDDWLAVERQAVRRMRIDLMRRLAGLHLDAGDREAAIAVTRRRVLLDPLDEDAHRTLMRLLAENGDRVHALQQFKQCAEALQQELGIAPDAETMALHDRIKSSSGPSPAVQPPATPSRKLSVAVLPFAAVGASPDDERLADALSRDLIAELGRFSPLAMAGAVASFAYSGRNAGLADIRRELDVRFVIDGTVETRGAETRLSAQVTDAETGRQVWAQRYMLDTAASFQARDELVATIAGNLYPRLMAHSLAQTRYQPPEQASSADIYSRLFNLSNYPSAATQSIARELCFKLIAIDPDHALVFESLSWTYLHDALNAWADNLALSLRRAREAAARGIAIDAGEPYVRIALGCVELYEGRQRHAREEFDTAVACSPNDGIIAALAAEGYACLTGWTDEAFRLLEIAQRLNPGYNLIAYSEGFARLMTGEVREAAHAWERFITTNPDYHQVQVLYAAALAETGDEARARRVITELSEQNRLISRAWVEKLYVNFDPGFRDRVRRGVERAGLRAEA